MAILTYYLKSHLYAFLSEKWEKNCLGIIADTRELI